MPAPIPPGRSTAPGRRYPQRPSGCLERALSHKCLELETNCKMCGIYICDHSPKMALIVCPLPCRVHVDEKGAAIYIMSTIRLPLLSSDNAFISRKTVSLVTLNCWLGTQLLKLGVYSDHRSCVITIRCDDQCCAIALVQLCLCTPNSVYACFHLPS